MDEENKAVIEDFDNLIDNKKLRDENIRHIEVLGKVKELIMLPELNLMTTEQIATYYEVPAKTIKTCYRRNKNEIDEDGTCLKSVKDFQKFHCETFVKTQSCAEFQLSDSQTVKVPNRGLRCFTQRAVLRFGMLLRDSAVAREVRTQLLNIHQKATKEQKQTDLNEELELRMSFANAMVDNDPMKMFTAYSDLINFKNRHIEKLEKENGVSTLAYASGMSIQLTWNLLYKEAFYKYKLNLRSRKKYQEATNKKKVSMLDLLRTETEWRMMVSSLAALCESQGVSVEWVFKEAKLSSGQMYNDN